MVEDKQYGFVAYIDEAGDPGITRVRPIDENGATEWLMVSVVVVSVQNEPKVPGRVHNLRSEINSRQGPELHFRKLGHSKALRACEVMAGEELRIITMASNKKNMRGHRNKKAEAIPTREWFYNFCIRILLERVTWFAKRRSEIDRVSPLMKIVFSERGGVRYSQTRAYLKYIDIQARAEVLYPDRGKVIPEFLD